MTTPNLNLPSKGVPTGSVGTMPEEAKLSGKLNASIPENQKNTSRDTLDSGPRRDEAGAFLPARYEVGKGIVREDR